MKNGLSVSSQTYHMITWYRTFSRDQWKALFLRYELLTLSFYPNPPNVGFNNYVNVGKEIKEM